MKEHALLLSTPMVQAYLANRKIVTRRIPGPTNSFVDGKRVSGKKWKELDFDWTTSEVIDGVILVHADGVGNYRYITPIYQPGDWLWFRETWAQIVRFGTERDVKEPTFPIVYKADGQEHYGLEARGGWKPSIHMPKDAARLWAEVTTCACERVQDITEEQAIAEGVQPAIFWTNTGTYESIDESHICWNTPAATYLNGFKKIWSELHGPESWQQNPPIYAISYKILSTTGKPLEKK